MNDLPEHLMTMIGGIAHCQEAAREEGKRMIDAEILAYANQVREQALEEAAKVCEAEADAAQAAHNTEAEYGADMCAVAIRKLKERSNVQP